MVAELVAAWQGRVEIVEERTDILRALRAPEPVLLICGDQLTFLTQHHQRRWKGHAARVTVVLVETLERIELVDAQLPNIDAVLLWELHQGIAIEIVQSAKSGVRTFPPEVVDRLIFGQGDAAARPPGDDVMRPAGQASLPSPPCGPVARDAEASAAEPVVAVEDAGRAPARRDFLHRLVRSAIARVQEARKRAMERR